MKSLKHYIVESLHTYSYRIKLVGDIDENQMSLLKYNLEKFSPVKISEPKTTPLQKQVPDFPGVENDRVSIIDAEFRYPANEAMIKQLAQLLGIDPNHVRVIGSGFEQSMDEENDMYANQASHSPLLTHEELEENPKAKDAAKAYGNSYLDSIREQHDKYDDSMEMEFAGEKTPPAFDPFKPETFLKSMGTDSPMTKVNLPPKPATGRGA